MTRAGVSDPDPDPKNSTVFEILNIEQGKKVLAALEEKGGKALKALIAGDQAVREA